MDVNVKERAVTIVPARLSLKAKAALAWERERPAREAARIEQQARELQAVRDKLVRMFGLDQDIKLGIDGRGSITAAVEDLRFRTHIYSFGIMTVSIYLIKNCPNCGEDVPMGSISDLADLGELISISDLDGKHTCHQK
jgi:hypothetical protein